MNVLELFEKLKPNPTNPRVHTRDDIDDIKKKLRAFPKMLEKRPLVYDNNFSILGGNLRYKGLKELVQEGFELKLEYFSNATDWTEDEIKQFIITDNISDGEWDWEVLHKEWDKKQLEGWGLELEPMVDENFYERNVEAPIYEPTNVKPELSQLVDATKVNALLAEIEKADISEEEKKFLRMASYRHYVFSYSKIADYYAHSSDEVKRLMENSALVIIDFKKAIELGYVDLTKNIAEIVEEDYDTE